MALFKILKGPEKKDSTGKSVMLDPVASGLAIKEGWAYVTDAGNFYVDISDTTRVKINQNADYANIAYNDSANQPITSTYIKEISFLTDNNSQTGAASNPYLKYLLGNNTPKVLALPAASASQGGILTASSQEIKGKKTFNDCIAVKLDTVSDTTTYYPWFSSVDSTTKLGTPVYDTGLSYNAKDHILTTTNFVGNLTGTAEKATGDSNGNNIANYYVHSVVLDDETHRTFEFRNGNNVSLGTVSPYFAGSNSCGGDALKAIQWSNAVTIKLEGEVTGSASIAGNEGTVTITTSLANTNLNTLNGKYLRKDQADSTNYTLTLNNTTDLNTTLTTAQGALIVKGGVHVAKQLYASKVYNSVWNDYAECRKAETLEPGRVIIEDASGEMKLSSERLQPGGSIISDTYGHSMGYTEECKTPVAVAGRVLAYYDGDINMYTVGAAVGTGPNGTVSLMTREEIMTYPDRIIGIVSEIPSYEEWGPEHIKVNGRIWIKIK